MKLVYWAAHRQVGRRHVDGKLSHQTHIGVQFLYEVAFDFLQKLYLTKHFLHTLIPWFLRISVVRFSLVRVYQKK